MDIREADRGVGGQAGGVERQRRLGGEKASDTYGVMQATQLDTPNQLMDKQLLVRMLYQRANEIEANARGIKRLAELVNAASDTDFELFSMLLTVIRTR